MISHKSISSLFITIISLCNSQTFATGYNVADKALTVDLKKTCDANSSNCFDTTQDLSNWIETVRKPKSTSPLDVSIGAGKFPKLFLTCDQFGYTSFNGAGRGVTTIRGATITGCTGLNFNHLTIEHKLQAAVNWHSNGIYGTSNWNDVELIGAGYAWYEQNAGELCLDSIKGNSGKHYWTSSKLISVKQQASGYSYAYRDACGSENWFFGSELTALSPATSPNLLDLSGYIQDSLGDTHIYGSVIRVISDKLITKVAGVSGVFCSPYVSKPSISAVCASKGTVHIHGTGIDVISNVSGNDLVVLFADTDAHIHANSTAYNLNASTGDSVIRILNNGGSIKAPYLWEESNFAPNITSADGADTAIIVAPSTAPKFIIYSSSCESKWFDVGINDCMQ